MFPWQRWDVAFDENFRAIITEKGGGGKEEKSKIWQCLFLLLPLPSPLRSFWHLSYRSGSSVTSFVFRSRKRLTIWKECFFPLSLFLLFLVTLIFFPPVSASRQQRKMFVLSCFQTSDFRAMRKRGKGCASVASSSPSPLHICMLHFRNGLLLACKNKIIMYGYCELSCNECRFA